jgi:two-component system response regulator (stage 0 sporulation protein F)
MMKKLEKILVVDDEVFICELLDEFLSMQGYDVNTANCGEDAISMFKNIHPEVVLLDIRMPGITGIDVLEKIKNIDSNVKIIMLSAFGDVDTVHKTLQMGAFKYMQKPVDLGNLLLTLNS